MAFEFSEVSKIFIENMCLFYNSTNSIEFTKLYSILKPLQSFSTYG